jgi:hypothetical protein
MSTTANWHENKPNALPPNGLLDYNTFFANRRTPKQIKNEKKFSEFNDKLSLRKRNLNNSNYSEINNKLKEYYSKYYEKDLNKLKSINNKVKQIRQKYRKNSSISHNLWIDIAPRYVEKLKQDIYMKELEKVIQFLCDNIDNLELFPDFLSIVLFVANKRKMIEFLKLSKNFDSFGSLRNSNRVNGRKAEFRSNIFSSSGTHLLNNKNNKLVSNIIKYYNQNLTEIRINNTGEFKNGYWVHPSSDYIPRLLYKMNKLYKKFKKSLLNKNNKEEIKNSKSFNLSSSNDFVIRTEQSKDLLCELYWLFIQTCPFIRGSAAIAEIIFSALLQKHFGSNFKLLTEKYNAKHVPDIHALTYPLEKFKKFFWEKLVSKINNSRSQANSGINNSRSQANSGINNSRSQANSKRRRTNLN